MNTSGLSDIEVINSRNKFGSNILSEKTKSSFWNEFIKNLSDPMIKILIVALTINSTFAILGKTSWYECVGIASAILIASLVSTYSCFKNEKAFKKLQQEAALITNKTYRNGHLTEVMVNDIVVGDVVLVQIGDKIPADGILILGNIKVNQSSLNGESSETVKEKAPENYEPTNKDKQDLLNPYLVFRGTTVYSGEALIKITSVGDNTIWGTIANELQDQIDRASPLTIKLSKLAKQISYFGYLGGFLIALSYIIHFISKSPQSAYELFTSWDIIQALINALMFAVVLIVMAVPEGLPLMIAIVSSINMRKMLKDNVLVRTITGIETAGSLQLLFSDKTGTITKGELETIVIYDGNLNDYHSIEEIPTNLRDTLTISIALNTQCISSIKDGEQIFLGGNATDRALMNFVKNNDSKNFGYSIVSSNPFDSANKYSSSEIKGKNQLKLYKGAPEIILNKCVGYYNNNGQLEKNINSESIENICKQLANRSIRVLAIATTGPKNDETELYLVGIAGIRDEIRQEAKKAIAEVQNAGVNVIMLTGDRKETAQSIGYEIGLLNTKDDIILTSSELSNLSDSELHEKLPNIKVIARALPSDKSRLVNISEANNIVVGMTGDGVNDSPALKKADVGFAMGSGSEVAKEASDIIILDNNFKSIEKSILYGRTIFNNIRKFIVFQLSVNLSAVLITFLLPLFGSEMPLNIIQMLWINLIMDTLAALALGGEIALKEYLNEKPKKRDESIISSNMYKAITLNSIWILIISFIFLLNENFKQMFISLGLNNNDNSILTGYFTFFVLCAVFNTFNVRTSSINLLKKIKDNVMFIVIIGTIIITQVLLTESGYIIPIIGKAMRCFGLSADQWIVVILMSLTVIPIDMVRKMLSRK